MSCMLMGLNLLNVSYDKNSHIIAFRASCHNIIDPGSLFKLECLQTIFKFLDVLQTCSL